MSLVDDLLSNPDVSRVLCIAVATEAQKANTEIDSLELGRKFNQLVRGLDRKAFVDEARKLSRMGPSRYLKQAGNLLGKQ